MQYTVFETAWGFFGLACQGRTLCRACLPTPDRTSACRQLLGGLVQPEEETALLADLQSRIIAYFEGEKIEFGTEIPVQLDGLGHFSLEVLGACRKVGLGQTVAYGDLACRIGRPKAARAVGAALGRNPIPLIIPCHRVICSTGRLGGFSAPGGTQCKDGLLRHEQRMATLGTPSPARRDSGTEASRGSPPLPPGTPG